VFALLRRATLLTLALLPAAAPPIAEQPDPNAPFGLPSPAKADPSRREDDLSARPQYVLSYNARKRTPNWVCWKLKQADIGPAPRGRFVADPDLPAGMAKVTSGAYTRTGFDWATCATPRTAQPPRRIARPHSTSPTSCRSRLQATARVGDAWRTTAGA
jgi:DNA/RNA endonuclease G (NUC1)